ncbi:hypothetical protein [Hymenobacter jeollabukensis]|uniref:STAS/SEC14 domain-containing protein n=1 Tax=Hymenobacter jeollabukensis TaxID=2025313 RepID=A0A5R8WUG6_9BACT|nr:hypothetical protein [Hymenobacter jeollabukensis]TLM95096.1 hypothetical protein FDY95_04670 [Hymenobacter jeollabukensis]
MTIFYSPAASLTYHAADEMLHLSFNATHLDLSFGQAYQCALQEMLTKNVGKLLLDLKRNAPSSDDHEQWLVEPLQAHLPARVARPVFIAAVLSEGQYQYQISNCPISGTTLMPEQVEFNYFTSRREATAWLNGR